MDKLNLGAHPKSCLGIVGESGCGKSTVGLSIMGLIPNPPGEVVGGEIIFEGRDIIKLP